MQNLSSYYSLTDAFFDPGCYRRGSYKTDTIYTFYDHKDIRIVYSRGKCYVTDLRAKRMLTEGFLTQEQYQQLLNELFSFFSGFTTLDAYSIEELYAQVCRIRLACLGKEVLRKDISLRLDVSCGLWNPGSDHLNTDHIVTLPPHTLWQDSMRDQLLSEKSVLLFALCEPELLPFFKADFEKAKKNGKKCFLITGDGTLFPDKQQFQQSGFSDTHGFLTQENSETGLDFSKILKNQEEHDTVSSKGGIDHGQAALFVYGEDGFLSCRNLTLPSVVLGIPKGYYARAVTGQFGEAQTCLVYIPAHFNITRYVPLTERTCLSFRQLVCLCRQFGSFIYQMTPGELYCHFPQYFLSMYDTDANCPQAERQFPLQIQFPSDMSTDNQSEILRSYCSFKEQAIGSLLESRGTPENPVRYFSAYFDAQLIQKEIPWCPSEKQDGILVQGIRCARAKHACVLQGTGKLDLKQIAKKQKKGEVSIFSNFLFFQTEKLAAFYNELRADRPKEQICFHQEHLDYMLETKNGRRTETFPLYNKACLAMKKDGRFLFFHFRLGGGELILNHSKTPSHPLVLHWKNCHVDVPYPDPMVPILVYTPYGSQKDLTAAPEEYRLLVGDDRINLVIIQNRIICIRRGNVVLPSIGVVISLSSSAGEALLSMLSLSHDGQDIMNADGYYDVSCLTFSLHLDPPSDFSQEEWGQVCWAYGGGLGLIENGISAFTDVSKEPPELLVQEGWLSPLSRQTQESPIHMLTRHPRTGIGFTKNGDLFLLIFSGRSLLSRGADYAEMGRIAHALIPDVQSMMNVDGGASSVLGLAADGSFLEVSLPAPSNDNPAGMARPVVTAFCLEL